MFKNILLPTDGSEGSERAVDTALEMANTYEANLHVLYVIDANLRVWDATYAESVVEHVRKLGRDEGRKIKDRGEELGIHVETSIVRNKKAYEEIKNYSDENDIDLIIMGTHGRTGLDRFLLGSTAERVLRTSDIPVMTVSMKPEAEETPV